MKITGTLINYYVHCKRQCYLFGNRLNFEDNSEQVRIGKSLHEERLNSSLTSLIEMRIDNIRIDQLTPNYLCEIKKSDADVEACKWQLYFYLKILKQHGIIRKGKLDFLEKNKINHTIYLELNEAIEKQLLQYEYEISELLSGQTIPEVLNDRKCRKCAYFEYCYI